MKSGAILAAVVLTVLGATAQQTLATGYIAAADSGNILEYTALPVQGPVMTNSVQAGLNNFLPVAYGNFDPTGAVELAYMPSLAGSVTIVNAATGTQVRSFTVGTVGPQLSDVLALAAGDVNGDGQSELITGGTNVRVYNTTTGTVINTYNPFPTGTIQSVASGDLNHDGHADIFVGGSTGTTAMITTISGSTGDTLQSFQPFGPSYTARISIAVGDVNGDGVPDIAVGGGTGEIKVFDGTNLSTIDDFSPFGTLQNGIVAVALADLTGDGRAEIIAGTPHAVPGQIIDAATQLTLGTFLFESSQSSSVSLAAISTPEPTTLAFGSFAVGCLLNRRRK